MIHIAMLSRWHVHADGYAAAVRKSGKAEINRVWDEDRGRGQAWAESLGVRFESDLAAVLSDPGIDAVIVDTPTTDHDGVISQAVRAGKSVFTEKTLSVTAAGARELASQIRASGITFAISLPQLSLPATRLALRMIRQGEFGDVVKLRIRNAHGGKADSWLPEYWYDLSASGGGALMDLGCHPVYLANALLGRPATVSATFSPADGGRGDEESSVVLTYPDGVQAILETSFLTPYSPRLFEIYGTRATLLCENDHLRVCRKPTQPEIKAEFAEITDEPAGPAPLDAFFDACQAGQKEVEGCGTDAAVSLSELLELAYVSAATQKPIASD